jgi:hypothetical protein
MITALLSQVNLKKIFQSNLDSEYPASAQNNLLSDPGCLFLKKNHWGFMISKVPIFTSIQNPFFESLTIVVERLSFKNYFQRSSNLFIKY